MAFSSAVFLFLFLPAVTLVYFLVPRSANRLRNGVLLLASLGFFCCGGPKSLCVFGISLIGNYFFGLGINKAGAAKKPLLLLALAANLGLLGFYKYAGFFTETLGSLLGLELAAPAYFLPLGISFYTFQGLSYLLDIYRGRVPAEKSFWRLALYQLFFPQLTQGPIIRYETMAPELAGRRESLEDVFFGFRRFVFGLSKKMLLANTFGELAGEVFARGFAGLTPGLAWLGAGAYTLQIYFDFSGYSDMAIGLGRVFGFTIPENFNYPYAAKSITDFWRRWHITLSQWFRDYVYIPLGGNRKGKARRVLNLLVVWGLTGLWHGASWTFVAWGLYFALLLILEKLFLGRLLEKLWRPLRHAYALFFIVIGWVIFQSPDFAWLVSCLKVMFTPAPAGVSGGFLYYLAAQYKPEIIAGLLLCGPFVRNLGRRWEERAARGNAAGLPGALPAFFSGALAILLFLLSLLAVVNTSFSPFLYFQF